MSKSKFLPTNCPNCGAVLLNGKCEYCGTRVMFPNTVDVVQYGNCEMTLNIQNGDTVYVLPLRGIISDIILFCGYDSTQEIEFNFSGILKEG